MSAERGSLVFGLFRRLSEFGSLPTSSHLPFTAVKSKMGSASPTPSFARLGDTALFKPLELGKWPLQHRIVQVSAIIFFPLQSSAIPSHSNV